MFKKLLGPFGHFADGLSVGQALWGWSAFWTAVAAVSGSAAYAIDWVRTQGWGAAFFVGIGTAVALLVAVSLGMFALGYLRSRSATGAPALAHATHPSGPPAALTPVLPAAAADDLARRVAALERELREAKSVLGDSRRTVEASGPAVRAGIAEIASTLRAEVDGAKADLGSRVAGVETAANARLDQRDALFDRHYGELRAGLDALRKEMKAAIADAARDAKGGVDGAIAGFGLVMGQLGQRVGELETRAAATEHHFRRLLRMRDAARRLRPLFEELRPLGERLLLANKGDYPDGEAWRTDYEAWRAKLAEFWRLASRWDPPGIDPLALSADDLDRVKAGCGDGRFADFELQRRRRVLVAAHLKHGQYAGEALARIEAEAYGEPT